jgi:hypothetical protein
MKSIALGLLLSLASAELRAVVDPPIFCSAPAVELRTVQTRAEEPTDPDLGLDDAATALMPMEVETGGLVEMLKLLLGAAQAGEVLTVKLIIGLLEYWRGQNEEAPTIPSRLRGDFYYFTKAEAESQWFAQLEDLLARLNVQDIIRQASKMQEEIHATYQMALIEAAIKGHPIVMDLIIAERYRMRPFTAKKFLLEIVAISSDRSPHHEPNVFACVIRRVLGNELYEGGMETIREAMRIAKNQFVLQELARHQQLLKAAQPALTESCETDSSGIPEEALCEEFVPDQGTISPQEIDSENNIR